jgi:hypothetical protein
VVTGPDRLALGHGAGRRARRRPARAACDPGRRRLVCDATLRLEGRSHLGAGAERAVSVRRHPPSAAGRPPPACCRNNSRVSLCRRRQRCVGLRGRPHLAAPRRPGNGSGSASG